MTVASGKQKREEFHGNLNLVNFQIFLAKQCFGYEYQSNISENKFFPMLVVTKRLCCLTWSVGAWYLVSTCHLAGRVVVSVGRAQWHFHSEPRSAWKSACRPGPSPRPPRP